MSMFKSVLCLTLMKVAETFGELYFFSNSCLRNAVLT